MASPQLLVDLYDQPVDVIAIAVTLGIQSTVRRDAR